MLRSQACLTPAHSIDPILFLTYILYTLHRFCIKEVVALFPTLNIIFVVSSSASILHEDRTKLWTSLIDIQMGCAGVSFCVVYLNIERAATAKSRSGRTYCAVSRYGRTVSVSIFAVIHRLVCRWVGEFAAPVTRMRNQVVLRVYILGIK